ncbi:MAG: signal peptidase II, partial [Pseudomonadota bacterium]
MGSTVAVSRADAVARPRRLRRLWAMLLLVTAPVLALDQLSKLYIATHFHLYQAVVLVSNWLDITYTLNPGAAFSLFATMPEGFRGVFFLTLSAIAIVVLVALMARRSPGPLTNSIAFALILGGTIGNLIDRIARGKVIDFIYFHHDSFRYPVFNVADSAITIGVAIIVIFN